MALSSDRVQFCGANDADHAAFAAEAEGTGIRVAERTDELGHLCLQGPWQPGASLQTLTTSDLSNSARSPTTPTAPDSADRRTSPCS